VTSAILILAAALAQVPQAPKPIIDNERVRVWQNVQPMGPMVLDAVSVSLSATSGSARFTRKGESIAADPNSIVVALDGLTRASGASQNLSLLVELKDHEVGPLANTSGVPDAFPRPGITQLLDNDRVTVWDYTWAVGEPTQMHFHSKDVVVMFLEDGPLESTTPDSKKTVNEYKSGNVRFNARDRVHFETLLSGKQRAVIVELKP
jgi:hypothetical protein